MSKGLNIVSTRYEIRMICNYTYFKSHVSTGGDSQKKFILKLNQFVVIR